MWYKIVLLIILVNYSHSMNLYLLYILTFQIIVFVYDVSIVILSMTHHCYCLYSLNISKLFGKNWLQGSMGNKTDKLSIAI